MRWARQCVADKRTWVVASVCEHWSGALATPTVVGPGCGVSGLHARARGRGTRFAALVCSNRPLAGLDALSIGRDRSEVYASWPVSPFFPFLLSFFF
jgi:hypothetical protein